MGKRLEIDACIGSEIKDTQGETLSIEGADISELVNGGGRWNDNHGKGFFNSLGRITYAKKIMSADDAQTDREKYYWDKVKSAYVYAKGYLYNDDEDHLNAKAAAAILKNIHKTDAPLRIKASVEGGVVSRGIKDPSYLARTKIHSVALTFTPANNATLVEPLNLVKCDTTREDTELIKSALSIARDDVPSFIDVSDTIKMKKIEKNIRYINDLVKEYKNKYYPSLSTGKIERQNQQRQDARVSARGIGNTAQPVIKVPDTQGTSKNVVRTKNIDQWQKEKTMKMHAGRAMRDEGYLKDLATKLSKRGMPSHHVDKVIGKITTYIGKPTNKLFNKSDNLDKAMAAGYAGAGSPMRYTGGSVMQSESLDGFKYMTCDKCGYEQIYMDNQVKCRKCNSNYSLKKLCSVMGI